MIVLLYYTCFLSRPIHSQKSCFRQVPRGAITAEVWLAFANTRCLKEKQPGQQPVHGAHFLYLRLDEPVRQSMPNHTRHDLL